MKRYIILSLLFALSFIGVLGYEKFFYRKDFSFFVVTILIPFVNSYALYYNQVFNKKAFLFYLGVCLFFHFLLVIILNLSFELNLHYEVQTLLFSVILLLIIIAITNIFFTPPDNSLKK